MSQQQPAAAEASASPPSASEAEYVDVLIPGHGGGPLRVPLPAGCANTTVHELREATLRQLKETDPSSTARYVRLIFRGKELNSPDETLAAQSVQTGSALHGMVTAVQPHNQQRESEARRAARQALASAVGSLLGDERADGGAAGNAAETAGARAHMSQNELMRLLHEETMLRRAAVGQQPQRPQTADGGNPHETAVPIAGSSQPAEDEVVETTDGGRVRVTMLAQDRGRQERRAPQAAATQQDQQDADAEARLNSITERTHLFKWSCAAALVAGFLLGPVAFFLPFERIEVTCLIAGFIINILCNFLW